MSISTSLNPTNQNVNVDAFFFKGSQQLKTYPKQMELNNHRYTFEDGLQCLVRKGQRVVRFFEMTDGQTNFRLKLENDQWTLIGTGAAA